MLDQQKLASRREETRERLFTDRYEKLLKWALRLTNQHRASAEDLVQDAFIQFTRARTSLESIENLDGYLRGMLRNMHLSRISRCAQQVNEKALSLADYDSFDLSWNALEIQDRVQAQEELRQICRYACVRKETSRSGSVFILRFFHEYSPTEISRLLCSSRHCVDQWQRLARREVRLYLDNPNQLRFVTSRPPMKFQDSSAGNGNLIDELRRMVFHSRQGECLSSQQLKDVYEPADGEELTTSKLAHIVSCYCCLDKVNELLGLPPLAERYYADSQTDKRPPDQNGGSGGGTIGGPTDLQIRYRRRLSDVIEHKPEELRIFVNGSQVSSLKVSSDLSELDLNLGHHRVEFVEILSEQNIQLLFLSIGDPERSAHEEWARIELSDSRTLDVRLIFEKRYTLQVVYRELLMDSADARSSIRVVPDKLPNLSESAALRENSKTRAETEQSGSIVTRFVPFASSLLNLGLSRFGVRAVTPANSEEDHSWGRSILLPPQLVWTHPVFLSTLVSLVIVGALLLFRDSTRPVLTASSLLDRASLAEEMIRVPENVTHRVINLEERRGSSLTSRRIEIWENSSAGDRSRRVYNESQQLVAGTWEKADGSQIIYHHGSRPRPQSLSISPENVLLSLDDIWQLDLSAKIFRGIVAEDSRLSIEERPSSYMISSETQRMIGATKLLKTSLVLSRPSLRAVEQTLEIERSGEIRSYRFIEASLEHIPQRDVVPSVFEPDPELLANNKAGVLGRPAVETLHALAGSHPAKIASTELEIDATYLLNQIKGDRSEQITLTRLTNGSLLIEGVVDTDERKSEFVHALAPIGNNPLVKIDIRTISEGMIARSSADTVVVREIEHTSNVVPADREVRDYLSRQTKENDTDEAVRSFSSGLVNRSYRALFQALELKNLMERFSNVDIRTVSPDAREKWLRMVRQHASGFLREAAVVRQQIQPVLFSEIESDAFIKEIIVTNDTELARAVEQLHKIALMNNEAIRSGFTISTKGSTSEVKSPAFWHSLLQAERIGLRIVEYAKTTQGASISSEDEQL